VHARALLACICTRTRSCLMRKYARTPCRPSLRTCYHFDRSHPRTTPHLDSRPPPPAVSFRSGCGCKHVVVGGGQGQGFTPASVPGHGHGSRGWVVHVMSRREVKTDIDQSAWTETPADRAKRAAAAAGGGAAGGASGRRYVFTHGCLLCLAGPARFPHRPRHV
jgi:hypothetical protein